MCVCEGIGGKNRERYHDIHVQSGVTAENNDEISFRAMSTWNEDGNKMGQ